MIVFKFDVTVFILLKLSLFIFLITLLDSVLYLNNFCFILIMYFLGQIIARPKSTLKNTVYITPAFGIPIILNYIDFFLQATDKWGIQNLKKNIIYDVKKCVGTIQSS